MNEDEDGIEEAAPWEDEPEEVEAAPEAYTPAQLEAARAEAATAAAAEARAAAESEFNERRSHFDRRYQADQEAIKARDAALAALTGAAPKAEKEAEPEFNPYDEASIATYVQAQIAKGVEAAIKPLQEQYRDLEGGQSKLAQPLALQVAEQFLAPLGIAGTEKTPEFRQHFDYAYGTLNQSARMDPKALRGIAAYALSQLDESVVDGVKATAAKIAKETAAQQQRDLQRGALSQTQPSMLNRSTTAGDTGVMTDAFKPNPLVVEALKDLPGYDADFHRAMVAPPLADGRSAIDALIAKREKAAAR